MTKDRDLYWLKKAEARAITTPRCSGSKIGALIVIKNRLISEGQNSYRTHPIMSRFGKNEESVCLHGEMEAIVRALRKIEVDDFKKATLYICRVKNEYPDKRGSWIFGMAHPCEGCSLGITAFEIKRVVYSLDGPGNLFQVLE